MEKLSQTPDVAPRLSGLLAPASYPGISVGGIGSLFGKSFRRRQAWNDRFIHWERAESTSETIRTERARDMVRDALWTNPWLISERVAIRPQGSFTNRTNVRNDADIDLRVEHPLTVGYHQDEVARHVAQIMEGLIPSRRFAFDVAPRLRQEIAGTLRKAFGPRLVDASGQKAIRVRDVAGSRGEVDVVPSFRFQLHTSNTFPTFGRIIEGSILLAPDGELSFNFSSLHIANGKWKRERTGHQFKKVVRIVKRLQMDMVANGVIAKRIPSFVIECLVYLVEDPVFLNAADRYSRVRAVLNRILELLVDQGGRGSYSLREINGVKMLFGPWQKCTPGEAIRFVAAALVHLGDC